MEPARGVAIKAKGTPLPGVPQRFGVTVTFTHEALRACRVTATFSPDDGLEDILTVLCGVTQSAYVVRGKTVALDGTGCP